MGTKVLHQPSQVTFSLAAHSSSIGIECKPALLLTLLNFNWNVYGEKNLAFEFDFVIRVN